MHSDSQYVVEGIERAGPSAGGATVGCATRGNRQAVKSDLWGRILDLCEAHEVEFRWVRGHAGDVENERCDQLAVQATHAKDLPVDNGYESPTVVQRKLQLAKAAV